MPIDHMGLFVASVAMCNNFNVSSTNSKFFNKRNFVAWFYRKLFTMTRKFSPENFNFLVIF